VVLEQVLADVEVVRLDLLLRLLDGARDHGGRDLLALLHAEVREQLRDAVAREDPHEVVLEREVEAGRARVSLPAAAAAELVVDAARLVAFGADDMEAAQILDARAERRAEELLPRVRELE